MQRPKSLAAVKIMLIIWSGFALRVPSAFSQSTSAGEASDPFADFFNGLAAAHDAGGDRGEASYMKLVDSLGTMTPREIAAGIPVIDHQLDDIAEPQDHLAKADAAMLLMFISWRPDGAELLNSEIDRLKSMLNEPKHLLSGPAVLALQHIGDRRPDVVIPILEEALKDPNVNNSTGVGPGIAIILLRMQPATNRVVDDIVRYMRRTDLTDTQLIKTIVGIDSTRFIPDALTTELVRCLDRPNEYVKVRALVGIARSSSSAKGTARARVQQMANDPRETPHVRRLAAEALVGEITEDPDTDR